MTPDELAAKATAKTERILALDYLPPSAPREEPLPPWATGGAVVAGGLPGVGSALPTRDGRSDPEEWERRRVNGGVRACRVCGCTEDDCAGCVERTGGPCTWVEADLCSACVGAENELLDGVDVAQTEREGRVMLALYDATEAAREAGEATLLRLLKVVEVFHGFGLEDALWRTFEASAATMRELLEKQGSELAGVAAADIATDCGLCDPKESVAVS
jgi:hypothetical protein